MPTPTLTAEARRHQADLDELIRLGENDVRLLLRQVGRAEAARNALMDTLPELVSLYGSAAATLGADWYEEERERAAVSGRFTAIPADLPDRGRTDALARWGVEPLFSDEPDWDTTAVKVAGGLQRIVADADRGSIILSAVDDRRAGWMRVGEGECDWCQQYLDGTVHYVEGYDFDAHDWCHCTAVPAFE